MHTHRFFNYRHAVAIAIMFLGLCFQATTAVGQNNQNGNSAARVGIDASAPAPMTLNEAIRLALANNNDIATSRIDVELSEHNLTAARGAYDPVLTSQYKFEHSRVPVTSFFGGTDGNSLKQTDLASKFAMSGLSPRAGGSYEIGVSSRRTSTNNFFNDLNPWYSTGFNLIYTQPLMRGRRTDDTRRRIEIAKHNLSLTDIQFRQRATEVITRVEEAYWQLVYALKNLQVQNEAVAQTKAQAYLSAAFVGYWVVCWCRACCV